MNVQVTIKYLFDRIFGLLLLVLLSPLFVAIAIAIWLNDRGPVFFKHERPGLHAQPFEVWKFRTMVVNADRFLDEDGQVTRPRVTRVGVLLRKVSLDELPQLINIVQGEMSLVGPRPAVMEHLPRYTDEQMERFRMKPGITGLAQVGGRNTLKWSERIRLDNEYIDNYSLSLDARILWDTFGVVLRREGIALDRNPEQVDDLGPARPDFGERSS
jgi:lipopolysaccharide/colanic/teichoic acid biosynthesis glycosyltransferase